MTVASHRVRPAWIPIVALLVAAPALADPWIAPGDARLRHDLQLLTDAGIVRAPLTAWPVPWGEVARDLRGAGDDPRRPAFLSAALARVRDAARDATSTGRLSWQARVAGSERPLTLRRFADVAREEGEVSAGASLTGKRFAFRFQATLAADADDDQAARADGSYAGVVLGNWILSAGLIDRWWGPGWEGSLILGTNARPMPALTVERNYSDPPEIPWLAWIGRWRLVATLGQFEHDRTDAPDARFFGMRASWKPHPRFELGLSRSAQWCGDGRPCDLDTFWDLLLGRDNDQPIAQQPGNQMAGIDLRWSIPGLPAAVYAQLIGEDEANYQPSKQLGLVGAEAWGGIGERSWRAHVEYADTACAFYNSRPQFGCAYHNRTYFDGYQYRDRVLGHAIDGDSRQYAAGAMLVNADGSSWEIAAQRARVNRAGANPVHSVSAVPARITSADVYHRRSLFGGDLKLTVGYEETDLAGTGGRSRDARGMVEWSRNFQ